MPRFLAPIYVKDQYVTGNQTITGNATILGVTSGKNSYWDNISANNQLSANNGLFTQNVTAYEFIGDGSKLTSVFGTDATKLALSGGELTGPLTGTEGLFTISLSAPSLSGTFYGDGSNLFSVSGIDGSKLPLVGGELTGPLTGTEGLFTISLSAPNLSGTFYGDGSQLTGMSGIDGNKLPLVGGELTGPLTGTEGLFTISLSAPSLSGTFYGDGSQLTGVSGIDGSKLPLVGGELTGPLTGTIGIFTISLSAPNLSGDFYGDGSHLTNVTGTDNTKLPLSGGRIDGNLVLNGSLTALSGATFVNTIFTTTSALSIINTGYGPALYVWQSPGTGDVASFVDGDGIEVLHVGNDGKVGISTSDPTKTLTVNGEISATSDIWANKFRGDGSELTNVLGTDGTKLPLSGGSLTGSLTGTVGLFTTSLSAPNLSGTYHGDGSRLTGVYGTDGTKLPLSGGNLTGSLTGTIGLFTTSLSAPNLSGTFYGDGSNLTDVYGTDGTKLPLSGGSLTGSLTGTVGLFTTSLSAPNLSGTFYGDGSNLTGIGGSGQDGTKLPLSGGILTDGLTGTNAVFNSISAQSISGNFYGDLSNGINVPHYFVTLRATASQSGSMNTGITPNTFTYTASGPLASIESVTPIVGDIILFTGQGTTTQNGPWKVVNSGSIGTQAVLERPSFYSGSAKNGTMFSIIKGTTSHGFIYVVNAASGGGSVDISVGITNLSVTQAYARNNTNAVLFANTFSSTQTLGIGTTTTAPLRFQAGTLLTIPVQHSVEWDGNFMYLTTSGANSARTTNVAFVSAPATSSSYGLAGQVAYDSTFFYVCTAANTWLKTSLTTSGITLGLDGTKLPLSGGSLTGTLTGTVGTFTTSLSAPNLSGTFYGDGSKLTGIVSVGQDGTKLPLSGGSLTGSLTGSIGLFTTSLSAPDLSGTFYGDGSKLTGVSGIDGSKLPLAGGALTGPLTGTVGTFTISLSAPNLSGTFYGDGSKLTNITGTDNTKLALSGGRVDGDLVINGGLTALSGARFVNTIFATTSALSIINTGYGPALYVWQSPGTGDVASFVDGDGIEVLHVGNDGKVGISTSDPTKTLTVNGEISATSDIWANKFRGDGSLLTNIVGTDNTKLPLSGGVLTNSLTGTVGLFTTSLSAPNLSGAHYGDGSRLTGVSGIDNTKLPLAGGILTGSLTGTIGLFTTSLSAPNLSGAHHGDGSRLSGVSGTDNTKLPLAGGILTGPLTGTVGLFTTSLSSLTLSGTHFGDGSKLTGIAGGLPLGGGTLTGGLTGTTATFNTSLSSPSISGTFYGDGGNLYNLPSQINFVFDGGGTAIELNSTGVVQIPYNIKIVSWTLLANSQSNCEVQVLTSNFTNHPTYNVISGPTNVPKLINASKAESSTMTDWVTAIPANSYLKFTVISNDSAINLTVALKCLRTS